jgi:HTH-type transcriptional regulator/antitoxin MqsA
MTKIFPSMMCPICEIGELKSISDGVFTFRHGKKSYNVPGQHHAECSECGTSAYLPNQRKINSELIAEFQAGLVDYVSPSDVLAVRERYSLTQKQASQIFKGGINGFSKWERGVAFPSGATAMLIKVALASPDAMKELAKIAGVDFPIVEAMSEVLDLSQHISSVKSEYLVVKCTHSEYSDDFVERTDIGYDNEKIGMWEMKRQENLQRGRH